MSIEVMKQALECLENAPGGCGFLWQIKANEAIAALRTAIQQAETNAVEPVAWIRRHPNGALSNELLIHVQVEQVRRDSGAWVPLYTHPAPGVPDWAACQRIAEAPEVDEALRLFAECETTEDQAAAIVQAVLTAAQAQKGHQ